jgi:hypothetical protein
VGAVVGVWRGIAHGVCGLLRAGVLRGCGAGTGTGTGTGAGTGTGTGAGAVWKSPRLVFLFSYFEPRLELDAGWELLIISIDDNSP